MFSRFRVWAHYPDGIKPVGYFFALAEDAEARKDALTLCLKSDIVTEVRLHSALLPVGCNAQELNAALAEDKRGEYAYVFWPPKRQFNEDTGKTVRQFIAEDGDLVINCGSGTLNYQDLISGPSYAGMSDDEAERIFWGARFNASVIEIEPFTPDFEAACGLLGLDRDNVAHVYRAWDFVFARLADII